MNDRATTLLEGRREGMERALGRPLAVPEPATGAELSESEREHLRNAATDLYVNELAWENITDEERVEGEPLAELAFPGFLAFIRGLLLDQVMPDSLAALMSIERMNLDPEASAQALRDLRRLEVVLDRMIAYRELDLERPPPDLQGNACSLTPVSDAFWVPASSCKPRPSARRVR